MLTKKTVIGIGAGAAICAIGVFALVTSFGIQTIPVDESLGVGENTAFQFNAPLGAKESLEVTGKSFEITLMPSGGEKLSETYKDKKTIEWVVVEEGQNRLEILNTGDSELKLKGAFEVTSDPILFTYHILVITAGVVIIGFSAAFSVRKPRGF